MEILTSVTTAITALGGYELVKHLLYRRSNRRISRARAQTEEFHALREYNDFLQKQLDEAGRHHAEQTELVRRLNAEILSLTTDKATVELELALKRCEVQGCPRREPKNGY